MPRRTQQPPCPQDPATTSPRRTQQPPCPVGLGNRCRRATLRNRTARRPCGAEAVRLITAYATRTYAVMRFAARLNETQRLHTSARGARLSRCTRRNIGSVRDARSRPRSNPSCEAATLTEAHVTAPGRFRAAPQAAQPFCGPSFLNRPSPKRAPPSLSPEGNADKRKSPSRFRGNLAATSSPAPRMGCQPTEVVVHPTGSPHFPLHPKVLQNV